MSDIIIIPLSFLLFVLMGSLFMCGLYVITREGKIFGFWSLWWEEKYPNVVQMEKDLKSLKEEKEVAIKCGEYEKVLDFTISIKIEEDNLALARKRGYYYKRPLALLSPMSGCVYCYGSVYGSLFFWFMGKVMLNLVGWDINLSVSVITLWVVYCISTSALNGILIKKVL